EIAKYELMWKLISFLSIALVPTTVMYYFFDNKAFFPSLYATISSLGLWLWLYTERDYLKCSAIYIVHSILFLGVELILKTDIIHLIEFSWFFVFTIYGMLILGIRFGILLSLLSMFFITYYLFFCYVDNVTYTLTYIKPINLVSVVLNLLLGLTLMGYLIQQFKKTRAFADSQFQKANKDLTSKNELIKAQAEEKTIMLKEIHHRVKNNLQVISSLVRLQSFETEDPKAKKMFEATVNRVVAMALIHEKMYQRDNLSKINLEDYLKSLANDIFNNYAINKQIDFSIKSNIEVIGNRTIVPLALIFNELISNSIKYAFNTMQNGQITVHIFKFSEDIFVVKYSDNGKWLNPSKSSFGLELIETFTEQLDGEMTRIINESGTFYTFKLKNIE
ncbi:MAG TPA: sensor histidine kinase, partial [Crocinitomix sp.]|nr:sensor histidine kinase [Crocinitomix sp.]